MACVYGVAARSSQASPVRAPQAAAAARGEAERAEDVGQVPVHGVLAEHELAGDVGVGQSLRDEFE